MRLTRSPLAKIRQRAQIETAKEAAAKLGISVGYMYEVEGGKAAPSQALVAELAKLYRVSDDDIRAAINQARLGLMRRVKEAIRG